MGCSICELDPQNFLRSGSHFVHSPAEGLEVNPLMKSTMWRDSGFKKTSVPLAAKQSFAGNPKEWWWHGLYTQLSALPRLRAVSSTGAGV